MKTNKTSAIVAVAASIAALVSCQKVETSVPAQDECISTITLTIEQPSDEDAVKTFLGTETSGFYPINWSSGDKIAVSSQTGSSFEDYTLSNGIGTQYGTFTGTAVSGAVYSYYPYSGVTSVSGDTYSVNIPATQAYAAGSFGESALPMYGIANSTGDLHKLKPLMSVLKLPLKGTCKVRRIVVSSESQKLSGTGTVKFDETTASMTVTGNDYVELICPDVQLNESTATLFHIAIPASAAGAYTVRVITDESKVLTKTLTVSTAFTAGKMKKTAELTGVAPSTLQYVEGSYSGDPVTIAGYAWAPVNCGYDATSYPNGKFYQWAKKQGFAVSGTVATTTTKPASMAGGVSVTAFIIGVQCWYDGNTISDTWPTDKSYDPCPTGWRVPTGAELTALIESGSEWDDNDKGRYFPSKTVPYKIFLPAIGSRSYHDAAVTENGALGIYWSSSPILTDAKFAQKLHFRSNTAVLGNANRAEGMPVRCVQAY